MDWPLGEILLPDRICAKYSLNSNGVYPDRTETATKLVQYPMVSISVSVQSDSSRTIEPIGLGLDRCKHAIRVTADECPSLWSEVSVPIRMVSYLLLPPASEGWGR